MKIVDTLGPLMGEWTGVNQLRLMPTDDYRSSAATATVAVAARGFVTVAYTWEEDGKAQDGIMLVGDHSLVWVDSWHSAETMMEFTAEPDKDDGVVRFTGVYAEEWGWYIHFHPAAAKITMHNVPPGEQPYQVVEIALGR